MIVTWDFTSLDANRMNRPELFQFVKRVPSPYDLWAGMGQQLRALGVLSERDLLHLHVLPMPKSRLRIVVLLGIFLRDDPAQPGGVAYEMRELGRIEYPSCCILCDRTDGRLAQLRLPLITPSSLSAALVEYLLHHGCVRVRTKGGAYYVPEFALASVEEVLHMLEAVGMRVRRIHVERGSQILLEIAHDAVASFRQAMAELTRKVREAKQEKVRQRALGELKQLREFYKYYLQLFQQLGGELEEEQLEGEVGLEALSML